VIRTAPRRHRPRSDLHFAGGGSRFTRPNETAVRIGHVDAPGGNRSRRILRVGEASLHRVKVGPEGGIRRAGRRASGLARSGWVVVGSSGSGHLSPATCVICSSPTHPQHPDTHPTHLNPHTQMHGVDVAAHPVQGSPGADQAAGVRGLRGSQPGNDAAPAARPSRVGVAVPGSRRRTVSDAAGRARLRLDAGRGVEGQRLPHHRPRKRPRRPPQTPARTENHLAPAPAATPGPTCAAP
jgi:hypothetical protein